MRKQDLKIKIYLNQLESAIKQRIGHDRFDIQIEQERDHTPIPIQGEVMRSPATESYFEIYLEVGGPDSLDPILLSSGRNDIISSLKESIETVKDKSRFMG